MIFGVDAHKATLAVCGVDELGRERLGREFANDPEGHAALLALARALAPEGRRFGVECSGSFGRALAVFLLAEGERVAEVPTKLADRGRRRLRGRGKSDRRDALAIARALLREGQALDDYGPEVPGARDLKLLVDYRRQLLAERTRTANRVHADLVVLAPGYQESVGHLRADRTHRLALELLAGQEGVRAELARSRIGRLGELNREIRAVARRICDLVAGLQTGLVELVGVGPLTAAQILGEVRDVNRFATRDRFARANGTAPIPASSGQRQRHRLNRGGNRKLNHALHVMALTQARHDPRARAFLERRRAEGRTYRDAVRALKRHLSDVVWQELRADARRSLEPAAAQPRSASLSP